MTILSLGESQLRGKVVFDTQQGVACQITFQDIFYTSKV